ncbi:hypothetical protein MRB53_037176 [Persea americana]|nr:hypothetical protein MRB53_037176 [Persea americana]
MRRTTAPDTSLASLEVYGPAALGNHAIAVAARHGAGRLWIVCVHRRQSKGVCVVREIQKRSSDRFLDSQDSDSSSRIAVLDARML